MSYSTFEQETLSVNEYLMLDKCKENKQRINLKLKWKLAQKYENQSESAKNNEEERKFVVIFFHFCIFLLRIAGDRKNEISNISFYERGMTYYESYSVKT